MSLRLVMMDQSELAVMLLQFPPFSRSTMETRSCIGATDGAIFSLLPVNYALFQALQLLVDGLARWPWWMHGI